MGNYDLGGQDDLQLALANESATLCYRDAILQNPTILREGNGALFMTWSLMVLFYTLFLCFSTAPKERHPTLFHTSSVPTPLTLMTSATKLFTVCVATALLFGIGPVFAPTASAQYPDPGRNPVQGKIPGNAFPQSLKQMGPEQIGSEPFRPSGIRSTMSLAAAKSADPLVPSASALFTRSGADLPGVDISSSSIADVDGQNGPDLLITGRDSNFNRTATLYLQQPDGSFQPTSAGLPGVDRGSSSIADIDGDGDSELLITGFKVIANAAFSRRSAVLYDNLLDPADAVAAVEVPAGASTQAFTGTGRSTLTVSKPYLLR